MTKQARFITSVIGTVFGAILLSVVLAKENWIIVVMVLAAILLVLGILGIVFTLLDEDFKFIKFKVFHKKEKKIKEEQPLEEQPFVAGEPIQIETPVAPEVVEQEVPVEQPVGEGE